MRGEYRSVATSTGCYGEHTHVRTFPLTRTRTPINANNAIAFSFEFSTHLQILHCTQLLRLTKLSPPVVSRFPFHQFCQSDLFDFVCSRWTVCFLHRERCVAVRRLTTSRDWSFEIVPSSRSGYEFPKQFVSKREAMDRNLMNSCPLISSTTKLNQ